MIVPTGKRRYLRNDFMGNAYNELINSVKRELS